MALKKMLPDAEGDAKDEFGSRGESIHPPLAGAPQPAVDLNCHGHLRKAKKGTAERERQTRPKNISAERRGFYSS
jgi:hypothetical protein